MIDISKTEVVGLEHAIRGMRNPMNSWEKSDSYTCADMNYCHECPGQFDNDKCVQEGAVYVGENDLTLMNKLAKNGPVHAKYRRMIVVYVDITAPLYWWKEFDTYKVGTVANSCSTMHKIQEKEFEIGDFSYEYLLSYGDANLTDIEDLKNYMVALDVFEDVIKCLNFYRDLYLETKDKTFWWQMIQLLPSSYNQKHTVMMNYEMLANAYKWRKDHKLDEWREFCKWVKSLPYSEIITGERR